LSRVEKMQKSGGGNSGHRQHPVKKVNGLQLQEARSPSEQNKTRW